MFLVQMFLVPEGVQILCIRGCRSLRKVQFIDNSISAIVEEGRLR